MDVNDLLYPDYKYKFLKECLNYLKLEVRKSKINNLIES